MCNELAGTQHLEEMVIVGKKKKQECDPHSAPMRNVLPGFSTILFVLISLRATVLNSTELLDGLTITVKACTLEGRTVSLGIRFHQLKSSR